MIVFVVGMVAWNALAFWAALESAIAFVHRRYVPAVCGLVLLAGLGFVVWLGEVAS